MSWYAIGTALVKGLKAQTWGAKVPTEFKAESDGSVNPVEGGNTLDTGVQAAITALVNRLQSDDPWDLNGAMTMNQDANSPAIRIYVNGTQINTNDQSLIQFIDEQKNSVVNIGMNGITQTTLNNNSNTANNVTNINDISNITNNSFTCGSGGFTGTITCVTGVSGTAVASGCDITLSLTLTTSTVTFQNGNVTGVA